MERQTTNRLLMVFPTAFGFNSQTAVNNYFQQEGGLSAFEVKQEAQKEFTTMVEKLRAKEIEVVVVEDTEEPHTPDAVFPNNWISFHAEKRAAIYPLYALNRRMERRMDILEKTGKQDYKITDFTGYEEKGLFLEGTGSMIFDRVNKIAYAGLSERTDEEILRYFCDSFDYRPVSFHSYQHVGSELCPIYHTNVMFSVATDYAVVCLDSITDKKERQIVIEALTQTGKEIIPITEEQMNAFAGNMLQVANKQGELFAVISERGLNSLTKEQQNRLSAYNELIPIAVPVIENYGGGSVRCMIAELF